MPETLSLHARQQLEAAIAPSLERIAQDREGTPHHIQRLLLYFEQQLFDPELDVTQAKRACGIGDNSVAIQFHSVIGRPPSSYIEDRRLEAASRLLSDSDFKIWQIAQVVGYSSISAFSRAFLRWSGERPSSFRKKRHGRTGQSVPVEPAATLKLAGGQTVDVHGLLEDLCPECRSKVLRHLQPGATPGEPAERQLRRVDTPRRQIPSGLELSDSPSEWSTMHSGDETDRYRAELIWSELENCSWEERRELVRNRLRLTTPSFFHFLRSKSWELGRRSLKDGVRAAQLALDSLESLDFANLAAGEKVNLFVQGWACKALALTLASDFEAAQAAVAEAEKLLGGPADHDLAIAAELLCVKATLRRNQRRSTEALELFDRALDLCSHIEGRPDLLAQLLIRRATAHYETGRLNPAIDDLERAIKTLDGAGKSLNGFSKKADQLKLAAYQTLAVCLEAAERYGEAMALLPKARRLCNPNDSLSQARLRWLEGRLQKTMGDHENAETAFLEVYQTFLDQEDPYGSAFACLDLTDLYARQGRGAELRRLSVRLAPLFEALQLHREAIAALRMFRQALEAEELDAAMIEEIRRGFIRAMKSTQ